MKILYYFLNIETMMYQWQRYHIFDELKLHGYEVVIFNPRDYSSVEEANEKLLDQCNKEQYGLFMTTFNETYLTQDTLKRIKAKGIPTLLFCPDNLVAPYTHRTIAPLFDLVWLTSVETQYLFEKWGCNTIFLPYAANPDFLKPNYSKPEQLRVGFIGTPHGSRIDRVNTLLAGNVPLTLHANVSAGSEGFFQASLKDYWNAYVDYMRFPIGRKLAYAALKDKLSHRTLLDPHPCLVREQPVPLTQLAETNCSYALVLSFTDANSTGVLKHPVPIVNLRNFEVPMSGALQLTTYTEELASYFEDGKEIVLCKSKEEYIEKAKYYLREDKDQERMAMKLAARCRAEAEHTWFHRFSQVFDRLSLVK